MSTQKLKSQKAHSLCNQSSTGGYFGYPHPLLEGSYGKQYYRENISVETIPSWVQIHWNFWVKDIADPWNEKVLHFKAEPDSL